MPISLEQLAAEALALPAAERVQLADRLWASVDAVEDLPLSEEWLAEIERRIKEINNGTETVPSDEVFAKLDLALERHRNRR